jgi:hypothetical protein
MTVVLTIAVQTLVCNTSRVVLSQKVGNNGVHSTFVIYLLFCLIVVCKSANF